MCFVAYRKDEKMLTRKKNQGFTLIELLVVVVILAILFAILLPTLMRARAKTKEVLCYSNLRQMGIAFVQFSASHDGHIFANGDNAGDYYEGSEDWQRSWMGNEVTIINNNRENHEGLIVPYLGGKDKVREIYRCPSLDAGPRYTRASNGQFDYVSSMLFNGATLNRINAEVRFPDGEYGPTPLILEEDPISHINGPQRDPGHAAHDRMGTWHGNKNTGFYFSPDGAVHQKVHAGIYEGSRGDRTWIETPSGGTINLGTKRHWSKFDDD